MHVAIHDTYLHTTLCLVNDASAADGDGGDDDDDNGDYVCDSGAGERNGGERSSTDEVKPSCLMITKLLSASSMRQTAGATLSHIVRV